MKLYESLGRRSADGLDQIRPRAWSGLVWSDENTEVNEQVSIWMPGTQPRTYLEDGHLDIIWGLWSKTHA